MRLEVVVDKTHLLKWDLGQPLQKKKVYVNIQNKLKILIAEYNNGDRTINNFLLAISYVIRHLK